MTELDNGFMEVIASCSSADGEVDYADDGWKPPDGEYSAVLENFKTDTTDKDGVTVGTAKAYFRVIDGEFEGRSFAEFFWMPTGTGKLSWGHSNLLRLATCLAGRELKVAETPEAVSIIKDATGSTVMNVKITRTISKGNGEEYANSKFLGVVA